MPLDPDAYRLDLSGSPREPAATPKPQARPWLSVMFACCNAYQRVYRDRDGRSYTGRCPRCRREVRFAVGGNGTSSRQFIAR